MRETMSATDRLRRQLRPWVHALRSREERHDLFWELRRRSRREPALPESAIRNVLVICLGNICRSPFGERLLASRCPDLVVRSSGFEAREGNPAEPEAIRVAGEFGIDLSDHAAHRMTTAEVDWADLILGMTGRHHAMLRERWPAATPKLRLLGDYLDGPPHAIADPWGRPAADFRTVYAQIERASARLSNRLERARATARAESR